MMDEDEEMLGIPQSNALTDGVSETDDDAMIENAG